MANDHNTVTVTGNLTRDPELRFTSSGQAVTSFTVAVNRSWRNKQTNDWDEATSFIDVTCWAQLAENVGQSLAKGSRVMVSGRLDQRSWDDKTTGDKRSKIEIVADEVAPSLRWATAEIVKNERREPGDGGGYAGGGGGGGSSRPASNEPSGGSSGGSGGYDPDEEPF